MMTDSTGCSSFWDWLKKNIFQPVGNAVTSAVTWVDNTIIQPLEKAFSRTLDWVANTVASEVGRFFVQTVSDFLVNSIALTATNFFMQITSNASMRFGGRMNMRTGNLLAAATGRTGVEKFQHVSRIIGAIGAGVAIIAGIVSLVCPPTAPVAIWFVIVGVIIAVIFLPMGGIQVELN